jgi:hypothetical protein
MKCYMCIVSIKTKVSVLIETMQKVKIRYGKNSGKTLVFYFNAISYIISKGKHDLFFYASKPYIHHSQLLN